MKIGRLTVSDRASAGIYADRSGPEIERLLRAKLSPTAVFLPAVVPDEFDAIAAQLRNFADLDGCALVVTTGGTGIGPRDITPEATRAVLEKELPGFGEIMRVHSFAKVRTSILSRATAGTRGRTLIVNLPGSPKGAVENLGTIAAVLPHAIELLRAAPEAEQHHITRNE